MNRGYIKFWRKAQDSSSWNRGLMYQGLIINLLTRAAWKKSNYQGREILPGQFGAVMSHLAESLGVPRSSLQRMVAHLEADDFLKVANVGNRFVVITIVNWHSYQESEKEAWAAGGQPAVNQRAIDGQPLYMEGARDNEIKEVKKEEYTNTPPTPPQGGGCEPSSPPEKKKRDRTVTGNSVPRLNAIVAQYTASEPLRQTLEDFRQMRERIRKPMTGKALQLLLGDLNKFAPDDAGKIAVLEQSIKNSWQCVYPLKEPVQGQVPPVPPVPPPETPEQRAARKQREQEDLNRLLEQSRRQNEEYERQKQKRGIA